MATRTVLVAVDDSEASERVVRFVNGFFTGLDVEVIGINVGRSSGPRSPRPVSTTTPTSTR